MKEFAALLAGAVLLVVPACGHSLEYTALNAPPRPLAPRAVESVEVFMTKQPDRPFVEVGLFEIEQQSPASGGTPEMIAKLRARAAEIGCDAVAVSAPIDRIQGYTGQTTGTVNTTGTVHTTGAPSTGVYSGTGQYQGTTQVTPSRVRSHRASCLVFTDVPKSAVPASPATSPAESATQL